jgi:uncharacterized membrane protein YtjA (UPF0391 family)
MRPISGSEPMAEAASRCRKPSPGGTPRHFATYAEQQGSAESRLPVGPLTEANVLYWALVFLVIAIIAGFLGFGGVAFAAAEIAKILFFLFLTVFVVMLVTGLMGRRRSPPI